MTLLDRLDKKAIADLAVKAVTRPFALLLAGIAAVFPRDRSIWVFGSWKGERYADNAKWLFRAARSESGLRPIWVTRSRDVWHQVRRDGGECYLAWTPSGVWYCLRAGVYIYDSYLNDINYWTSFGAMRVNLWHGIPLKKIERDIEAKDHNYILGRTGPWWYRLAFWLWGPWVNVRASLMTVTSPAIRTIFERAFGIASEHIVILGLPRNDPLVRPEIIPSNEIPPGLSDVTGRVILYLPTFRDDDKPIPLDWARLDETLAERGDMLVVKLHVRARNSIPSAAPFRAIRVIPPATDLYSLLSRADILITDYSSVYIDYLLTKRPIVFFPYDLEEYRNKMRGLYFEYDAMTPGPKARTSDELIDVLKSNVGAPVNTEYEKVRDFFHAATTGRSSEQMIREIQRRLYAATSK